MEHKDLVDLVVAVIVLTNTLLTVLMGWRNGRKTDELHHEINSKMDKLVQVAGEKGEALGKLAGRKEVRDEIRALDKEIK